MVQICILYWWLKQGDKITSVLNPWCGAIFILGLLGLLITFLTPDNEYESPVKAKIIRRFFAGATVAAGVAGLLSILAPKAETLDFIIRKAL